jgi:hypothetical protein
MTSINPLEPPLLFLFFSNNLFNPRPPDYSDLVGTDAKLLIKCPRCGATYQLSVDNFYKWRENDRMLCFKCELRTPRGQWQICGRVRRIDSF